MKNWKFVQTGNETPLKVGDIVEVSGKKGKITKIVSSDVVEVFFDNSGTYYPDRTDRYYTSEVKKVGNESVDKQEWSMFKGLKKDAEKEVGNSENIQKIQEILEEEISGKVGYWEAVQKIEAAGARHDDAKTYAQNPKKYSKHMIERRDFGNKAGNASASEDIRNEYNAEIHRLEKKMEELYRRGQGHSAMQVQKQIEQLQRELRELGNSKTGNRTIMDDSGRFIWGYVEKENDGYSAYTHGITGAKDYLLKAKDETTATKELKDYCRTYWKKQGNSRMCNETAEERKFGKVMGEFKEGTLKSSSGETVTDPAQAKAIAYSESEKVDNLKRARNSIKK